MSISQLLIGAGWLLATPVMLLTAVFTTETLLGLRKPRHRAFPESGGGRLVILIPAHNEAQGIRPVLIDVLRQLPAATEVMVVADNCNDDTAQVARSLNVAVVERFDNDRRGKGFALDFGRHCLAHDPPDCVIVLDADCTPAPGSLEQMWKASRTFDAPVQAANLLRPDTSAPIIVQVSNFAFYIKNFIRQSGLQRLGVPALLNGTGMAFPWRVFASASLATDSLAEDLQLGLELVRGGEDVIFLPSALVTSEAASATATLTQRSRWEAGFLEMAKTKGFPLLFEGLRRNRWALIWTGLHLLTPPLTLLLFVNFIVLGVASAAALSGYNSVLIALCLVQGVAACALGAAWLKGGRAYLTPSAAARLPVYLIWKALLYLKLARNTPRQWIRTARDRSERLDD